MRCSFRRFFSAYNEECENVGNHSPAAARQLVKCGEPGPCDLVRSPAILEFAEIKTPRYKEKDLEAALINNMRMFLMELGRDFCLEAEQKKLNIGDATYRLQSSTTFRFRRYRSCSKNSNVNVQP